MYMYIYIYVCMYTGVSEETGGIPPICGLSFFPIQYGNLMKFNLTNLTNKHIQQL